MLVQVLVRWTEVQFKKPGSNGDVLKKLLDTEGESERHQYPEAQITYTYTPMVFDTNDVSRWNGGLEPDLTTVRFKDGDAYVFKYPFENFCDLMSDALDKSITVISRDFNESIDNHFEDEADHFEDEDEFDV